MCAVEAETVWTQVGDWRIHARRAIANAPPTAPTIVLVPGLGMSHRYMMPTLRALAPHARVYALDLPGFGESDKPARVLDVAELAAALAAWIEANGLQDAALVGNSFGCQVIAELVVNRPELARALVFITPTIDPRARTIRQQLLRLTLDALRERLSLVPLAMWEYFLVVGFRRALATLRFALADSIEQKLPHVALPTLVVRGGRDPLVSQQWAEEVTRLLPRARLVVIPCAAHAVNYDAPDALAREILNFLRTE